MTTIRRATPADAPAVTEVVRESFSVYIERLGVTPWPMRSDYAEVIGRGETWVAADVDDVAGVLVLEQQDDHLLLDVIAVRRAERGSGVGYALMLHAENVARGLGLPEVRLYTNEKMSENLAYYPRLGYVETGREEVFGFHRVKLRKRLAG